MKKFLFYFLTLSMAVILCLSGTACSNTTLLSFSDKWNGGTAPNNNFKETLTYSVEFTENYKQGLIVKDSDVTNDAVKLSYENGKYVQTLTTSSFLPEDIPNEFDKKLLEGSLIYHLQTELTIDVKYEIADDKDSPITHTDTVLTDTYFLSAGHSLAPIWSRTSVDNVYLMSSSNETFKLLTDTAKYDWEIIYNESGYKMIFNQNDQNIEPTESNYSYTYKSAIDNNQLLFAIRNIAIEEKGSYKIPTVSPSYGESKPIGVYYDEGANSIYKNNLSFKSSTANVTDKAVEIPVKDLKFMIDALRDTGAYHYASIQKSATEDIPNRSLLTEYAAPVMASFGSFKTLGATVYKLVSVTVE